MAWPMSQDYNEAIQDPAQCFADPELQRGEVVTSALGLPIPCSGNFADVYAVVAGPHKWAVKCFTREIAGLKERYAAVSQYLQQVQLPFMVDFRFLEQGIRVRGQWYPVLKMQWVEGLALNSFVRENLDKPQVLDALCQIWHRMAVRMREASLSHCDLQHGNVLMVQGAVAGRIGVRLVDYDGVCVPALEMLPSIEAGHPSYQHPQRLRERTYGMEVDRFSNLAIYTALRALKIGGKTLWQKYDNGDNLLFRQADFAAPQASAVFQDLLKLNDGEVTKLAKAVALAAKSPMDRVPLLEQLIGAPKTGVQAPANGSWPGGPKPPMEPAPFIPSAIPVNRPAHGSSPAAPKPQQPTDLLAVRKKRVAMAGLGVGFLGIMVAGIGGAMLFGGGSKDKDRAHAKAKKESVRTSLPASSGDTKSTSSAQQLYTNSAPSTQKLPPSRPVLIFQCGKGKAGSDQAEMKSPGYDCRLIQGGCFDGWSGDALKTHCWAHEKAVRFEVIVPPGKEGVLRLWLVDGDNLGRKERVSVQGRTIGDYAGFGRRGVEVSVPISAEDARTGRIGVSVVNMGPGTAAVSTIAFTPQAGPPLR